MKTATADLWTIYDRSPGLIFDARSRAFKAGRRQRW